MRTLAIIAALLSPSLATAEECKLEQWTFRAAGGGTSWTYIDGATSCVSGKIHIRIYDADNDRLLATETAYIEGFAFKATVEIAAPARMTLKYAITE